MKQLAFLVIVLISACRTTNRSYDKVEKLLGNPALLVQYPNLLILSDNQCHGCVYNKLTEFIDAAGPAKQRVLIVIDTLRNSSFGFIKGNLSYVHVPQRRIEAFYPVIVNYMLIKTEHRQVVFERDFVSSGDTSHLMEYL